MVWEPGALTVIESLNLPFVIQVDSERLIVESILKLYQHMLGLSLIIKGINMKPFFFFLLSRLLTSEIVVAFSLWN